MADSSSSPEASKVSSSSTGVKAAAKKPAAKATHPSTAEMVMNAIETLKERKGSSLAAIKKFMATEYDLDAEKQATYIKKFLKKAVESGELIQTSGTGATGSFRLPKKGDPKPKAKSPESDEEPAKKVAKKTKAAKETDAVKKAAAKKPAETKKTAEAKTSKAAATKKSAKTDQVKSPSKMKKTTKSPTKPKAPRAKKTASPSKTKAVKN